MIVITGLVCVTGIIIGASVCYIKMAPKVIQRIILDTQTQEINEKLKESFDIRFAEHKELEEKIPIKQEELYNIIQQINDQKLLAQNQLFEIDTNLAQRQRMACDELTLFKARIQKEKESLNDDITTIQAIIEDERRVAKAAVEANKRAKEINDKDTFYRLVLNEQDLYEIKELKTLIQHFKNPEPINKVIWKTYYEKPTSDLIGRVVGVTPITGIYKITNLQDGMCYVGQAVKLAGEKLFSVTAGGLRFFSFWNVIGNNYQTAS